jgi:hypothetical protein
MCHAPISSIFCDMVRRTYGTTRRLPSPFQGSSQSLKLTVCPASASGVNIGR